MSSNSAAAGRGRPRNEELRLRILRSAAELASTSGTDLSFDRISLAANASRTTLYRWWSSPQELLLDALMESTRDSMEVDDDRDVVTLLRAHVSHAATILTDPSTGGPLRTLIGGALRGDDSLTGDAFVERWLRPRRDSIRQLIDRAIDERRMPDCDPEDAIDILFGPIYYRTLFTRQPVDDKFVDQVISAAGITYP